MADADDLAAAVCTEKLAARWQPISSLDGYPSETEAAESGAAPALKRIMPSGLFKVL